MDERIRADALKTVDFAGLDDEDLSCPCFELTAVNGPQPAAGLDELHFIVRMPVRTRSAAWRAVEEKRRQVHVAILGADEVMGTSSVWKFMLL